MSVKYSLLKDILGETNNHNNGLKYVFENSLSSESALMQFAYGKMKSGQQTGFHQHATMNEYFYFLKGEGTYLVGEVAVDVLPSLFVKIPASTPHNLNNNGEGDLEFIYFGIETQ